MLKVLVLSISASICIIDLRSHRIPNRLTLLLAGTLICDSVSSTFYGFLTAAMAALFIAYFGKVGAGDVKLFLALVATSGNLVLSQNYFLWMAQTSAALLLASVINSRLKGISRPAAIAFAPSILIPFLALYLAI
jgi:Flp pilus assembly protein protease CpaA